MYWPRRTNIGVDMTIVAEIAAEQKRVILDTWFNLGAAGSSPTSYPVYIGFTTANPTSRSSYVDHYNPSFPTIYPRPAATVSRYDVITNPSNLNPVWPHIRIIGIDRVYNWSTTSSITVQYVALFKTESPNLNTYSQSDYDEDLLAYWRLMDPAIGAKEASTLDVVIPPDDGSINYFNFHGQHTIAELFWKQ